MSNSSPVQTNHPMDAITLRPITDQEHKEACHRAYLRMVGPPLEGGPSSNGFLVMMGGIDIGHAFVDARSCLRQIMLNDPYQRYGQRVVAHLAKELGVVKAHVSTNETQFLSWCLDRQAGVTVTGVQFVDGDHPDERLVDHAHQVFRLARMADIDIIQTTVQPAPSGFYADMIQKAQLFVLCEEGIIVGMGEIHSDGTHVDIGMAVAESRRCRGFGTEIIRRLRRYAREHHLRPIACCHVANVPSMRALERAGMVAAHRSLEILFRPPLEG